MSTSDSTGGGMTPDATPDPQAASGTVAVAAKSAAKTLVCPICGTTFSRRANAGKCPVCGEQVEAPEAAAPTIPVITQVSKRLFQDGNWRLVAVVALIIYEIALGALLWMHLAHLHAL